MNVGTNVPIILPIVLKALSVPTVFPLSSRLSTVYFTSDGVTVPSKNNGNTNTTMQVIKAAHIRKLVSTATTSNAEIPSTANLPMKGMAAIHTAAMSILP